MRYDCPYCGNSLKRKLLLTRALPGQRRFLPEHATLSCPACKGLLDINEHPTERSNSVKFDVLAAMFTLLLLGTSMKPAAPSTVFFRFGAASVLVLMAVLLYVQARRSRSQLKEWQRYRKFETLSSAS